MTKKENTEKHIDIEHKNGKQYVSVTSALGIIKNAQLEKWRGAVGNQEADEKLHAGQRRGTRLHSAMETMLKGLTPVQLLNDEEIIMVKKFGNWFDKTIVEIALIEEQLYSDKFLIKGKPDLIARQKGKKTFDIFDFKFGKFLDKKKVAWQLSGYYKLAKENNIPVSNRYIFHFNKGFKLPNAIERVSQEEDFRCLLYCRELFLKYKK